ncbi:MAG: hypothetical protein U0136_12655 [Bdellovibrionota bacterium]
MKQAMPEYSFSRESALSGGSVPAKGQSTALLFALALSATLLTPRTAHAYVDPGTGSMVLQLLLAGAAGVGVLWKLVWRRIVRFVRPGATDVRAAAPGAPIPQKDE